MYGWVVRLGVRKALPIVYLVNKIILFLDSNYIIVDF